MLDQLKLEDPEHIFERHQSRRLLRRKDEPRGVNHFFRGKKISDAIRDSHGQKPRELKANETSGLIDLEEFHEIIRRSTSTANATSGGEYSPEQPHERLLRLE